MKKKFKWMLVCILGVIGIIGCQFFVNTKTKLVYETLSKREEYLLNLTGNRVMIYTIENLPKDTCYEIELVYEVYQDGKKVKEEIITRIIKDQISKKKEAQTIALNIQEDKIRYLLGREGSAKGEFDLEEDLGQYSRAWLTNDINLEMGTDIYILHANSGEMILDNHILGEPVSTQNLDETLKSAKTHVFLKLSFKKV
ncbi:MAG: hypothetical protein AB9856_01015 [Cellulosilyticaceae bacterium]